MRFAELEGRDVAIWGYGREGRSVLAAWRRRFPHQPLTLYCRPDEAGEAADGVQLHTSPPDASALSTHAVVIKSPGISAYRPEVIAARGRGVTFTSETALWFGENSAARVVAVTGTKGKSTTSALIAHLARALGVRTALAGNIGLPLLGLDGQHADLWVVELSSFQTGEAGPVELGVVVSLGEEHLDWHGTRERYVADKLKLADVARTLLVDAQAPLLMARTADHPRRCTFDDDGGWHVAGGTLRHGAEDILALAGLPVHGEHNARNACAALAAIELLGLDANRAAASLRHFRPLPHRLTVLGMRDDIEWVDDSISTTPAAALAAVRSVPGRPLVLILGGYDRGLDWQGLAAALAGAPPRAVVTQGAAGPRIARCLRDMQPAYPIVEASGLAEAVARARALVSPGMVVLLSPGAPSFDQFKDYADRGRAFARLAGFDAPVEDAIPGLGIA